MSSSSRQSAHAVLRVGATLAAAAVLWYLVLLLSAYLATLNDPTLGQGRVWPYFHAHLREEYVAGAWNPLSDVYFLLAATARNILAFAVATILARRLLAEERLLGWLSILVSLLVVQVAFHRGVMGSFWPPCLVELALSSLGVVLGLALSRRNTAR